MMNANNLTNQAKAAKRADMIALAREICAAFERIHAHMDAILERGKHERTAFKNAA